MFYQFREWKLPESPYEVSETKYDRSSNLKFMLFLFIPKKYFLTELSYQQLTEELSQIIYLSLSKLAFSYQHLRSIYENLIFNFFASCYSFCTTVA